MKTGESVVRLLDEAGKLMASGGFTEYDLTFIQATLEKFLDATNKTLNKIKDSQFEKECDYTCNNFFICPNAKRDGVKEGCKYLNVMLNKKRKCGYKKKQIN